MRQQINSRWVIEKGRWNEKLCGPNGHEAYHLYSLLPMDNRQGEFCVCAGTINSWPACYVQWKDVKEFCIEYLQKEKEYEKGNKTR